MAVLSFIEGCFGRSGGCNQRVSWLIPAWPAAGWRLGTELPVFTAFLPKEQTPPSAVWLLKVHYCSITLGSRHQATVSKAGLLNLLACLFFHDFVRVTISSSLQGEQSRNRLQPYFIWRGGRRHGLQLLTPAGLIYGLDVKIVKTFLALFLIFFIFIFIFNLHLTVFGSNYLVFDPLWH